MSDAEILAEIDKLMNRLSLLSGVVRSHSTPPPFDAFYAINRAWRELEAARELFKRFVDSATK